MTEYFLRADGTAPNLAAATSPAAAATSMSIATFNVQNPAPGDVLSFSSNGGVFRDIVQPASSGNSGNPLTYRGNDAGVVLSGGELLTGTWSDTGSNVWTHALTTAPVIVTFDGVLGTPPFIQEGVPLDGVADTPRTLGNVDSTGDWFWSANVLHVFSIGDPAIQFAEVETSVRGVCVSTFSRAWQIFEDLTVTMANGLGGIHLSTSSDNIIRDCLLSHHGDSGALTQGGARNTFQNLTIDGTALHGLWCGPSGPNDDLGGHILEGCVVRNTSWRQGKECFQMLDNSAGVGSIVRRNHCINNYGRGILSSATGDSYHHNLIDMTQAALLTYGINVVDWNGPVANCQVYNNTIITRGTVTPGVNPIGINSNSGQHDIRNNIVFGDFDNAIQLDNVPSVTSNLNLFLSTRGGTNYRWNTVKYNWADYLTNSGKDANSLNTDPLLVNLGGLTAEDYKITPASPCRNAGGDVGLVADYFGTGIPQGVGFDIGFHEEGATVTTLRATNPAGSADSGEFTVTVEAGAPPFAPRPGDEIGVDGLSATWAGISFATPVLTLPAEGETTECLFGLLNNSNGTEVVMANNTNNAPINSQTQSSRLWVGAALTFAGMGAGLHEFRLLITRNGSRLDITGFMDTVASPENPLDVRLNEFTDIQTFLANPQNLFNGRAALYHMQFKEHDGTLLRYFIDEGSGTTIAPESPDVGPTGTMNGTEGVDWQWVASAAAAAAAEDPEIT